MSEQEIIHLLALQHVPSVGDVTARKLLAVFGSAQEVFAQHKHLRKIKGLNTERIANLLANPIHLQKAQQEWEYIQKNNINCCSVLDAHYPTNLKPLDDSPILFFHKGNMNWQNKRIISIVGTRNITPQGVEFTQELVQKLSKVKDIIIVSGFAYGVDIVAHKKAIDLGVQTIGCLAHGLDKIYPAAHKKYVNQMLENGGFITDFWHESPFINKNFLSRNRIIAGLSKATVVVESASKGGSLVTADIAFSYNREVFAVPGRPSDTYSQGCNLLIKTQKAQLIESGDDILSFLEWDSLEKEIPQPLIQTEPFAQLPPKQAVIYSYLQAHPKQHLDAIAQGCGLSVFEVSPLLFEMEMSGIVRALPGKLFALK